MSRGRIRIIIVDDSIVVRGIVSRLLRSEQDIEVVSTAIDGEMAVEQTRIHQPDIVILDIEMPRRDGLSALPDILKVSPKTRVIMASTLTRRNADISMRALQLGASDYLQKPDASENDAMGRFSRELISMIRALTNRNPTLLVKEPPAQAAATVTHRQTTSYPATTPQALAIASSTGGPKALTTLFSELKGQLGSVPIYITQHMPATFTTILAKNIADIGERACVEGCDGQVIERGYTYIAPGDYHMLLGRKGSKLSITLDQGPMVNFCRPSADPMIRSLVDIYGNRLLLVVLTGMGHDGLEGAKTLHCAKGTVIAQDQASSVVWGMPKAVAHANIASAVLPLDKMAGYLIKAFGDGQ